MKVTPLDIQNQRFRVRYKGFDVHEVDAYLEKTADAFETVIRENEKLKEVINRLRLESKGYKKREESFKMAMVNSQHVIEEMKKNALKNAELIIAEAEVQAEKILNRANHRLAQLHESITELKRQRVQVETQIRSILDMHSQLLDMDQEESQAADEADSKVTVLNRS